MNRLQKKCLLGATGLHLLLVAILIFGPAFLPTKQPAAESFQVIEFTPIKTTDLPTSGGGSPTGSPLPPTPALPKPQPATLTPPPPKPEVKPQPILPAPKPEPSPKPVELPRSEEPDVADTAPKKRLPEINTTIVTRRPDAKSARPTPRQEKQEDTSAAEARALARQRAAQFASATSSLRNGLSGATAVDLLGPGGGGIPYANFKQAVFSVYYNAWEPPSSIANENAIAKASVTIERDGTVRNAVITVPSGEAAMDASVRRTLERVKHAAPLPDGAKESERTLTIVFDLKAKRGTG